MSAAVAGGVLVAGLTELLGLLGGLSLGWLLLAWATALGAGLVLARRRALRGARRPDRWPPLPRGVDLALAVWIAVTVAVTGALALSAVPLTHDSMTYHLARVAHWAQNNSVDFYPTHILRQLYQPPWAEYALLNLFILAGGTDRLANLVQWVSMLASLVGVSVIARQLGAGRRGQLLSAFLCATIPMGLMQASTTQNDYVAALWLVCLVSALLALDSRPGLQPVLCAGASLGLALLSKGTSYTFAAPFLVVFVFAGQRRTRARKLGQLLLIGLCAVALNAPHYARNLQLFGAPLGPGAQGSYRFTNDAFWPTILASNVLRNVGLHVGTPSRAANAEIERAIDTAHAVIGIAPDDPRSTWPTTRFRITTPIAHEDLAPNGLHLLLMAAALVWVGHRRDNGRLTAFASCLVAAFLLFCLVLRWQPWHSRLHLPLFVLASPLIGVVLERLKPTVLAIVVLLLATSSVYFLTQNRDQALIGRHSVFRSPWTEQRLRHAGHAYVEAVRFVMATGCRDVGLALAGNDREYYWWALLADTRWRGRLEPVAIANASARLPRRGAAFDPCVIVREGNAVAPGLISGLRYYHVAWSRDDVQVLTRGAFPAAVASAVTGPAAVHLLLQGGPFRSGDRVTIGLDVQNPLGGVAADVYVGIILPDGRSATFLGPAGLMSDAVSLAEPGSFPVAIAAAPGFRLSAETLLYFPVPSEVPPGSYRVFATMVKQGASPGPRIPPEDALASDMRAIELSP